MIIKDCWRRLDAMFQNRAAGRYNLALVAVFGFIVIGAALYQGYQAVVLWNREQAILQGQVEETRRLVVAVADRRVPVDKSYLDSWGVDLRIKDNPNGILGYIEVASAGPDLTFGTEDDISEDRSLSVRWDLAGEKLGKTVGDFGIGAVKGVYRSAKDYLAGQKREDAHANPDASPNEGTNP